MPFWELSARRPLAELPIWRAEAWLKPAPPRRIGASGGAGFSPPCGGRPRSGCCEVILARLLRGFQQRSRRAVGGPCRERLWRQKPNNVGRSADAAGRSACATSRTRGVSYRTTTVRGWTRERATPAHPMSQSRVFPGRSLTVAVRCGAHCVSEPVEGIFLASHAASIQLVHGAIGDRPKTPVMRARMDPCSVPPPPTVPVFSVPTSSLPRKPAPRSFPN